MDPSESNEDIIVLPEGIIVRPVEERDITDIINLLKLNYGEDYPDRELYDVAWVKRAIYSDNILWWLVEKDNEVVASGAIALDYGDYDDQLGILGRLVARPGSSSGTLRSIGNIIVSTLLSKAENKVECVISDARTKERTSQIMVERARFMAAGFLPHYKAFAKRPESLVIYTKLYGEGRVLRSEKLPQVIPEVEPLATRVLTDMKFPTALGIVAGCPAYSDECACSFQDADRHSLGQLRQLDRGRLSDPVVFANISSTYGMAALADKKVYHRVAIDNQAQLMGAFGYRFDENNQIFQITELVFNKAEIINPLCDKAVETANEKYARIVEVDLSAYDARIQKTFFNKGFRPVAYIPAMVFHNNSRLDVVKMIKLDLPYKSSGMKLTKKAKGVVSLVRKRLK